MTDDLIIVYTTTPDFTSAQQIANTAIETKLAGCANILPQGTSIYMDNGILQNTSEFYIILKTLKHKESQLLELIQNIHPYQTPCIISFNVNINDRYKKWIFEQVGSL